MDFFFLPPTDSTQPTLAEVAAAAAAQLGQAPPLPKPPHRPIGMACRACRLRKIRCGGERPRCTYCIKKGYDCVLTPHKKRGRPRKAPTKAEDPTGDLDVHQLWAELTGGLQGVELPQELLALSSAAYPEPNFSFDASLAPMSTAAGNADMSVFAPTNYAFPFVALGETSPAQPLFGFLPAAASSHGQTPSHSDVRMESPPGSAAASSLQGPVDDAVRLYFVYVHPWMPILHRPTFERQVADGSADPLLLYAVQALAARFTESPKRKAYKRGRRFARAARRLLPQALKSATLSTLQAVTLLALYMSVSGQWPAGAALERLAVQLAFVGQYHLLDEEFLLPPVANNLGLYEAGWSEHAQPARLEVLGRPGGVLDHEAKRRAWWAVFHLERFHGLAMGRPPIIKPGWHWVWLPCSDDVWARENPALTLTEQSSSSRIDLVLGLIMGHIVEQRTDLFRLFFPRVDRGTLFHDNLPTHELDWPQRLQRMTEAVASLDRRIRQWHAELDRDADHMSARRHANLEIMGASCQIHLHAIVLQIREHLFEDMRNDGTASGLVSGVQTPRGGSDTESSLDFSAMFDHHTPLDGTQKRGYLARAKRPDLSPQFIEDFDALAQRCWDRTVAMADEVARLVQVHWLRASGEHGVFSGPETNKDKMVVDEERFRLMSPQTPYHLFVAGKVQAARLKQAVMIASHRDNDIRIDWDKHTQGLDRGAVESRLDSIISALEHSQQYWFSLNFASHLTYLKKESLSIS
ncbi:hypothetical protein FBU31_002515 [Coemansia sp. 'formosensis']|nr:hypothetical protein FBU31_002515 [Coemansia sp. 'formosensis']